MRKVRVYEYAKQMNMSSKEILTILKKLDIKVSNHMSVIQDPEIEKIENYFEAVKQRAAGENETAETPKETRPPTKDAPQSPGRDRFPRREDVRPGSSKKTAVRTTALPEKNAEEKKSIQKRPGTKKEKHLLHQPKNEVHRNGKNSKEAKPRHKQRFATHPAAQQEKKAPEVLVMTGPMSVGELAKALNRKEAEIIKKLMSLGIMATINQELEQEAIELIAGDYGVEVTFKSEIDKAQFELYPEEENEFLMQVRPPVVTIMGHVDHGKTTLLDAIRHSKVTAGEAGGITQHIGAYQVKVQDKKITFLDTPGHEAFTLMRSRGAQITDITVLVVAADDGVMPQTIEAIHHAKAANVPIIVAINKMDKPDANPDRVKQELTEYGLVPEEWGGETIFVPISALHHEGIDELLEMILLVAEVHELKANPVKPARGVVIEAELDKGKGAVATILVQSGTLRIGDTLVVGQHFARVRAMTNELGQRVKEAGPSTPVEITGLTHVPNAGDPFMVFKDEKKAKQIAQRRSEQHRAEVLKTQSKVTLDDLFKQIQEGQVKELNVIIKADVQGSAEALKGSLEKIDVEGARVKIIHTGVGAITESDVTLASASNAIIIGFNVRPQPQAKVMAEQENVDIRLHRIIYRVTEEIESAMKGLLEPEYEENVIGHAEVRQIFKVSRVGTIAGCYVLEGKVTRDSAARVIRDGIVIYEGGLNNLKRFKDDVKEVAQGYECGVTIENFNDIKEGDVIEFFVMEAVKQV